MTTHAIPARLEELFLPMAQRRPQEAFFLRLHGADAAVMTVLSRYLTEAKEGGVLVDERIPNPASDQISQVSAVAGPRPDISDAALRAALSALLPEVPSDALLRLSGLLCEALQGLQREGKPESALRSACVKLLCWLRRPFAATLAGAAAGRQPKVLYVGRDITHHELICLDLLTRMGADVLLVLTGPQELYGKADPLGQYARPWGRQGLPPFPSDFSLKSLRRQAEGAGADPRPGGPAGAPPQVSLRPAQRPSSAAGRPAGPPPQVPVHPPASPSGPSAAPAARQVDPYAYFQQPRRLPCTNAWMQEAGYTQALTPVAHRGEDSRFFYNCFIRLSGARDRLTYANELYQFGRQLEATGRRALILDSLEPPSAEELAQVRRRPYHSPGEMIVDLAGNLPPAPPELQREMQRAMAEVLLDAARAEPNQNRLTAIAVHLLVWTRRFFPRLFQGWKEGEAACLIRMGSVQQQNEAVWLRFMARLPVDVLLFAPNLDRPCELEDPSLLSLEGGESMPDMVFPRQGGQVQLRTAAATAEQELTGMLYTDTGLYREHQFSQAETIVLHTTCDEIFILWDQELRFRPSFSTGEGTANLPVLFACVAGVENGKPLPYWQRIRTLLTPDTLLFRTLPVIQSGAAGGRQQLALKSLRNGQLQRQALTADRGWPYGMLRAEAQTHMLDKLQLMLDRRLIRGTFTNGTEYTVISVALSLRQEVTRLIQGFDFTRKNPKVVVTHTGDQPATLEDAIVLVYLSLLGFDVVLFVPTGYQTIERFLDSYQPVTHQMGPYMYDLRVPDFKALPEPKGQWLKGLRQRIGI